MEQLLEIYINNFHRTRMSLEHLQRKKEEHMKQALWHLRRRNLLISSLLLQPTPLKRTIWSLKRNSTFWEERFLNGVDKFKEDYRCSPESFKILCDKLKGLERNDSVFRKCIPLEERIGIALYALGSSAEYRSIANLFGRGRTTVGEIVREFCEEVWNVLRKDYLNFYDDLDSEKLQETVDAFQKLGFPQCCGAIDGCHIAIAPPKEDAYDYYNFKGWHSILLLASVDYRYRFTYVNVGTPGRVRDSYVFETCALYKYHTEKDIFRQHSKRFGDSDVPVVLIGDSGFGLSRVLMKPFPFSENVSRKQLLYNEKLSSARRVVENAFGHLKARFRKVGRGLQVDINNVPLIIKACCVLHNFLNTHNDVINRKWAEENNRFERERGREQPQNYNTRSNTSEGYQIQQAIMEYIWNETHSSGMAADIDNFF